jgi:Glycosyl hydrolase catalytic core
MPNLKMLYLQIFTLLTLVSITSCKKATETAASSTNTNPTSGQPGVYSGNQMTISTGLNLVTPLIEIGADTVFSSYNLGSTMVKTIPTGFENKIVSVYIPKGYFAVVAANEDGTGESASFLAIDSAVKVNLPTRLRNNVSFIRYIKINNPDKKGTCAINSTEVQLTASSWYYGWSINRQSFTNQQFVPMTWGKGTATDANAKYLVERSDVDHLLSFNEPDGVDQSNIPVDTALVRYRVMIKSGLRLLSPVTTQGEAFGAGKWLTDFMAISRNQKMRMDGIAIHWYDWGSENNNQANDSLTVSRIMTRFKAYIQSIRNNYPNLPIWVTEYNANRNRLSASLHMLFMKESTEWMNTVPYIERYSYFFPPPIPALNPNNTLSTAAQYWKSLPSPKSLAGNSFGDAILIR